MNHQRLPQRGFAFFCILVLLLTGAAAVWAEPKAVKVAFVKIENRGMDPRYDYLEGILGGTLLFDLAHADGMVVVDRASLDGILKEQELIISDLGKAETAVKVGKILGADYLLKGQFVFLGADVQFDVTLISVETSKTLPFTGRGANENLVHDIAEQIIARLTGNTVRLQSDEHDRSIISLKDEKPGSIAFYCNLIQAEIFVDDKFAGYTTGKPDVPFEITDVRPGKRVVRAHLGSFGVVKQPEITFSDWQQTVDVKSGQRQVVRASISHLSYALYDIQKLVMEDDRLHGADLKKPFKAEKKVSFIDREGKKVDIVLSLSLALSDAQAELKGEIVYNGKTSVLTVVCPSAKLQEEKMTVEKIDVLLRLDYQAGKKCNIDYRVFRNDFTQDEWAKKK